MKNHIKPIALYLPQFHPIPENNDWWGMGFTEWRNVSKAKPLFENHYQPHLPADLGFYDLRMNEIFMQQIALAKKYGIYGFCFYHYWFNGKMLLEKPIENWLNSKDINFPFCLSWANENWTRRWDGQENEILMQQHYDEKDEYNHIKYLIQFFKDDRYIKINGRPVFLMYRSELHPDIKNATEIWREEVKKAGFPDLYLIRMENFIKNIHPSIHGFDAGMEFAPDATCQKKKYSKKNLFKHVVRKSLHYSKLKESPYLNNGVYYYEDMMNGMINRSKKNYKFFRCVCPSWDNSARRSKGATIYMESTPEKFREWVMKIKEITTTNFTEEEQLFFINAWNEWGEGCHLEPDLKYGHQYLEAFKNGLES